MIAAEHDPTAPRTLHRELGLLSSITRCGPSGDPEACVAEVHVHALRTSLELEDPLLELGFGTTSQITRGQRFGEDARVALRITDALRLEGGGGLSYERMDVVPTGLATVHARGSSSRTHAEAVLQPWAPLELRAAAIFTHDATEVQGAAADDVPGRNSSRPSKLPFRRTPRPANSGRGPAGPLPPINAGRGASAHE